MLYTVIFAILIAFLFFGVFDHIKRQFFYYYQKILDKIISYFLNFITQLLIYISVSVQYDYHLIFQTIKNFYKFNNNLNNEKIIDNENIIQFLNFNNQILYTNHIVFEDFILNFNLELNKIFIICDSNDYILVNGKYYFNLITFIDFIYCNFTKKLPQVNVIDNVDHNEFDNIFNN